MTYSKPEVRVLGSACALIEHVGGKIGVPSDLSDTLHNVPAYDLDE
jgi:hypothetical protein